MTKSSGNIVKYIESLFKSDISCDKKKKKKNKTKRITKGSKKTKKRSKHSNKRQLNSLPARYSYYM